MIKVTSNSSEISKTSNDCDAPNNEVPITSEGSKSISTTESVKALTNDATEVTEPIHSLPENGE